MSLFVLLELEVTPSQPIYDLWRREAIMAKYNRKDDKITIENKNIEGLHKTRLYVACYNITIEKSLNMPIPTPTQSF